MDISVHVVNDSSGHILSGSVDFYLTYQFPNDETVTGLAIMSDGSAVISTGISAASPVMATAGAGRIHQQAQIAAGDTAGLATLANLLANPGQYSANLVTADNPTGAMSGALLPANTEVLMAQLSSSSAGGAATVRIFYTGERYAISSAEVLMQFGYQFPSQVTFSSLRIYPGQGQSGTPAVAAAILPGTLSASSGPGTLAAPATEVDMTNIQMMQAVESLLQSPGSYSVSVGTVENPAAPLTGLLRNTDLMTFQIPGFAGSGAASQVRCTRCDWPPVTCRRAHSSWT